MRDVKVHVILSLVLVLTTAENSLCITVLLA